MIVDYSHTFSRPNLVLPHYDVIGAGVEVETGGHVFTIMFTNASGIIENDYLVNLKSEIQIRSLHQKIDLLIAKEMKKLFEQQKEQLEILNTIKNTNLK